MALLYPSLGRLSSTSQSRAAPRYALLRAAPAGAAAARWARRKRRQGVAAGGGRGGAAGVVAPQGRVHVLSAIELHDIDGPLLPISLAPRAGPPAGAGGVLQGARFPGAGAKKGFWNASPRPPSRRGVPHAERCAEAPPHQAHPAPGLIRLPGAT